MAVKAEVKTLITDVVLITYDIPVTQRKLRDMFLREAHRIGAISFTQSCYLAPYSEKTFALANELAGKADVVVWKSHQPDKEKALAITNTYEEHVKLRCATISQRLVIAQEYIVAGRLFYAIRMGIKTGKLLQELAHIFESFSPEWLGGELLTLVEDWKKIYGELAKEF